MTSRIYFYCALLSYYCGVLVEKQRKVLKLNIFYIFSWEEVIGQSVNTLKSVHDGLHNKPRETPLPVNYSVEIFRT